MLFNNLNTTDVIYMSPIQRYLEKTREKNWLSTYSLRALIIIVWGSMSNKHTENLVCTLLCVFYGIPKIIIFSDFWSGSANFCTRTAIDCIINIFRVKNIRPWMRFYMDGQWTCANMHDFFMFFFRLLCWNYLKLLNIHFQQRFFLEKISKPFSVWVSVVKLSEF